MRTRRRQGGPWLRPRRRRKEELSLPCVRQRHERGGGLVRARESKREKERERERKREKGREMRWYR